jgi:hypothetical protein
VQTCDDVRKVALSLPDVEEHPYHNGASFRIGKKVLATLWKDRGEAVLNINLEQQEKLIKKNDLSFYQFPNSWGKKGWTGICLDNVSEKELKNAFSLARKNFSA